MKQVHRSRLMVAIELPDPDPVAHKDYVDRLNKVASALDQLGQEDPRLYGELHSSVRYFQYLTTAAAKSGRLLLLHLDEMAAVTCILAGCGVFNFVPKKDSTRLRHPASSIRPSDDPLWRCWKPWTTSVNVTPSSSLNASSPTCQTRRLSISAS